MTPPDPRPEPRPALPIAVVLVLLVLIPLVGYVVQHLATAGGSADAAVPAVPAGSPVVARAPPGAGAPAPSAPRDARAPAPEVDPAWLVRTASAAGIPEVALIAYARAELAAPADCGLGWTTLAGIGWVESHHGTIGGRTVGADGVASEPVIGPALDGRGPVAAIRATSDSTFWHGDPRWDHAIGPMQFIPSTWETWQRDGDGDAIADPHDVDDAAAAAAAYLCADGRDLTTGEGWTAAVLAFNHSGQYLLDVHAAAVEYAGRTS